MVRRPYRSRSLLSVCVATAILVPSTSHADSCAYNFDYCKVPITLDSGPVENTGAEQAVIFATTVTVPQAASLRLLFSLFELSGERWQANASFVRVTSLWDGASVNLFENSSWIQAQSSTPAFNGESVLIELIAFPGTGTQRIVADQAWAGVPMSSDPDWVCFERGGRFIRGDSNFDGVLNLSDAVMILELLGTYEGLCYTCPDAADANDDGTVDLSDAITVLGYLFLGASPIPPPFPACGEDETPDELWFFCVYMRNCDSG